MALHPDFPKSPHVILNQEIRWYPGEELIREKGGLKTLLPPLVHNLRIKDEEWKRFVVKMATGSGKTKVLALILAWSYYHKLYEENSDMSRNFLLITPNIIVLDRIKADFDGLKIFFQDPILPENG